MSSRRLMNRSLSSDGRFYHGGNDIGSQNRRAGSMSYLSSVRSESRSTLCSVMAQLTEEIQPTFETTLKSKAVSEDTNVKFSCVVSGYPVPEVTWYKDDMQLDRYCGLPKYEISRDDKTHTLQIYNCTLDDAAIYQASAQNSRGIVSCSGVLEVGTMSEFKIHQNYFAKLKLRNENRRREQDEPQNAGKENVPAVLEDVRMSSPERAQRKRRSPMETRGAGSPSEDKAMEVDAPSQTPPVQVTAAASVHEISNSEIIINRDKDSQGLMYIHDAVNNVSSKQNNEHYVKKKIKISTDATEKIKENRQTGRREEMMNERDGASTEKMAVQNTVAKITSVTEHGNKMDSEKLAGDETQVCLAIIRMSKRDCGVYRCTITNEYGKDSTEYLLSAEFLSSMFLREELQEVGEEIEMTPLIFSKGLADAGCWGTKFYGRVTTEEAQVGLGCEHKTRRLKVIYGLDPVFESGSSCFMKVRSPIAYESREETVLAERNLQITKQDCRIQNMAREYFKIFATETRVIESFGAALEVIPLYFMYLPASSIPYATVEAELKGVYLRYCGLDRSGSLVFNEKLEVAQKCSCLQHWIHQWTNGNVLFSRLEGVDTILTNIGIAVRYQGFPCEANPKVFEQFYIQHQCNYFCGLLNLKPLKVPETLQTSPRPKDSSSPLLQRKIAPSSSSPQTPRKSPKVSRKLNPQT
ncbi:titin-like protein [Labeo rohita]|uniref:non-specific serine/threonine protein kinase n=1 Tax=Labeo rohita TaxID=84645 RepID=A0A498L7Q5_LABRO|nr:titin-like protein [Labeo rohita]